MSKLIAEIGINHFGKYNYLSSYISKLKNKNIDGVSIQILNKKKVSNQLKKYCLKKKDILNFFNEAKKHFNLVGVGVHSWNDFNFIKKLDLDFVKILGSSYGDKRYFNKIRQTKVKRIFLSTLNKSNIEIGNFIKNINKKKVTLIHTFLKTSNFNKEIKKIKLFRNKYNLRVAYGNHYEKTNLILKVCKYNPSEIFFYVKMDIKKKYPDDLHAIPINKLNSLIKKLKNK